MLDLATTTQRPEPLQALLKELGAASITPLKAGGSPACVLLVQRTSGEKLVVKYLSQKDGLVDGHDIETFRRKPQQIGKIHEELPGLSPFYADILYECHAPDYAAYCMPFYPGYEVTSQLRPGGLGLAPFFTEFRQVVETMVERGYNHSSCAAPSSYFQEIHLNRIKRRLWLLRAYLPREIMAADRLIINGKRCAAVPVLLNTALEDQQLARALCPPKLSYPVHGDANLGNFIITRGMLSNSGNSSPFAFKILDPRGVLEHWDATYDFAKMLFSLTLFELALTRGFVIVQDRSAPASYRVQLRAESNPHYLAAATCFLDFVESIGACTELLGTRDPRWRYRLLFSHAMHVIAESACRLSDRKPRTLAQGQETEVHQELALGLYLAGTLLLGELLESNPGQVTNLGPALGSIYGYD